MDTQHHPEQYMAADGASGAAAGYALKIGLAKFGMVLSVGVIIALLMAAVDPAEAEPDPKKRRKLIFVQVCAAGLVCTLFTSPTVRWLDSMFDWIQIVGIETWAEIGLPVALVWGGLAWGIIGALVKLRKIIAERGADAAAGKMGM